MTPFDANLSAMTRMMANGHRVRTGHALVAHYIPTGEPGITRMVRTCCEDSAPRQTEPTSVYLAQVDYGHGWKDYGRGTSARYVADGMRDLMERNGFRHGELTAHVADLIDGHVLTADNGAAFRVILSS